MLLLWSRDVKFCPVLVKMNESRETGTKILHLNILGLLRNCDAILERLRFDNKVDLIY